MRLRRERIQKDGKAKPSAKGGRVRRFLRATLLSAGIMAMASCGGDPTNNEMPCSIEPGPKVTCDSGKVMGTVGMGETLAVENIGILFEDAELHSETNQAIISVVDGDCNVLVRIKIPEGQTRTITVGADGGSKDFDVTAKEVAAGSSPDSTWATLEVSASGCEEKCEPPDGCEQPGLPTVVNLSEDETATVPGVTCRILEITMDVGEPQYPPEGGTGTCAVSNEKVELQIEHWEGWTFTTTLPEGGCLQMQKGCLSVEVMEITEAVGAADGNTCPVTSERVMLAIISPG